MESPWVLWGRGGKLREQFTLVLVLLNYLLNLLNFHRISLLNFSYTSTFFVIFVILLILLYYFKSRLKKITFIIVISSQYCAR